MRSDQSVHSAGRLLATPRTPTLAFPGTSKASTARPLKSGSAALVFVPEGVAETAPTPALVMLHGAGGRASDSLAMVEAEATRRKVIVLAPKSKEATWDVLNDGFGPDVEAIDEALGVVFERFTVDPMKIAIAGFSDGGSYALTLGLMNGDLFGAVMAFSPGFSAARSISGKPRVYISHGRRDSILPFAETGATLARRLHDAEYEVRFDPFDGGHAVPAAKVRAAMDWWLSPARPRR